MAHAQRPVFQQVEDPQPLAVTEAFVDLNDLHDSFYILLFEYASSGMFSGDNNSDRFGNWKYWRYGYVVVFLYLDRCVRLSVCLYA